jgi:hypothetical protein
MLARDWTNRVVLWSLGLVVIAVVTVSPVGADPTPKPVDVTAWKAEATVLQDAQGGTYVVFAPALGPASCSTARPQKRCTSNTWWAALASRAAPAYPTVPA